MTQIRKYIFVSQRVDYIENRKESRDCLDQRLVTWLSHNGYTSVPIPNFLTDKENVYSVLKDLTSLISPVGIVLSGGNDIESCIERDTVEDQLLAIASGLGIPVLGICRGFQFMNYWLGGTNREVKNHVAKQHKIYTLSKSHGEWPMIVNSFHSKTICELAQKFMPVSAAMDHSVESAVAISLKWEGWMWHPERFEKHDEVCNLRLKNLFG